MVKGIAKFEKLDVPNFNSPPGPLNEGQVLRKFGWAIGKELQSTLPATSGNYGVIFCAPFACEVRAVLATWKTASSSGTLQVERLQGTTAPGSGDDMIKTAIDTSGTADTVNVKTGTDLNSNRVLDQFDRIGLVSGGTLTNLADLCVTLYLVMRNNGDYR